MQKSIIVICVLVLHFKSMECASITPSTTPAPFRYSNEPFDSVDNGYSFEYATNDGQMRKEDGTFKRTETGQLILHVIGFYKYRDPDGKEHFVRYEADENGYQQTEEILLRPNKNRIHPNAVKSLIG